MSRDYNTNNNNNNNNTDTDDPINIYSSYHDPINYLRSHHRSAESSSADLRRLDSDDEGVVVATATTPSGLPIVEENYYNVNARRRRHHLASRSSTGSIEEDGIRQHELYESFPVSAASAAAIRTIEPKDDTSDPTTETTTTSSQPQQEQQQQQSPPPHRAYRPQTRVKPTVPMPPARERPDLGSAWPYRESLSFTRSLVFYGNGSINEKEHERACQNIQSARRFRQKYHDSQGTQIMVDLENESSSSSSSSILQTSTRLLFRFGDEGVVEIWDENDQQQQNLIQVPNVEQFYKDYRRLVEMCSEGVMRSFCFQRLQILSTSYKMHVTLNANIELQEQRDLLGTDFYRTMKVDNHIHAAAAPSAKQFVEFVRRKLQAEGDTIVCTEDETNHKTLSQIFAQAGLDMEHLTIDAFNVLADYSVYQRFDNFNSKYSPFKMADMRRIFLKTNNCIQGRFFAELLKVVLDRHKVSKGHHSACEMRLSIYGMERHEWHDLAVWLLTEWPGGRETTMVSCQENRWLVQIPRLWRIYSTKPNTRDNNNNNHHDEAPPPQRSFSEMLENLFVPLFEATLHPEDHPEIAEAMKHIVGFDSVDDEGVIEEQTGACTRPKDWTNPKNPAYWWQLYFLWANLEVLNALRRARSLNEFAFRPHAGETGDPMHLAATYMLCDSINHGILLDAQVSLQYLYYLDQVGLSISPLSNNFLFRKIADNPFPKFFRRGLNVTLSTDDPLLFHMSDDALLEEYSVARATFDLSMTDLMEIARNSILQSGFGEEFKQRYLGAHYRRGLTFCDENATHVPLIRAKFRAEHLALEHMLVHLIAAGKSKKVLEEMKIQFGLARDAHRDILFESFDKVPYFPERGQL
jgi:AMP deaminase